MERARISTTGREFPIGKIICIGRNYVEHIRELGNETPEAPVIFMKPASSVIGDGGTIVIPSYSSDCHHEAELALLVGTAGKDIPPECVMEHLAGFGVAIDLTLRDVQAELKKKGLPWEIAKGFDTACPLSAFISSELVPDPHSLRIRLEVNGELRQDGTTAMMIHSIPSIVSHMSGIFRLEPGDVILTGTPAGVGPLKPGDDVVAEIPGVGALRVSVRQSQPLR
jgi:5-carboxymethyl-2-hydroxymuconate isomerase